MPIDSLHVLTNSRGHQSAHAHRFAEYARRQGARTAVAEGTDELPDGETVVVFFDGAVSSDQRDPRGMAKRLAQQRGRLVLVLHRPWSSATRRRSRIISGQARTIAALRRRAAECFAPVHRWCEWLDATYLPVGPTTPAPLAPVDQDDVRPTWFLPPDDPDLALEWVEATIPPNEVTRPPIEADILASMDLMRRSYATLLPYRTGIHAGHAELFNSLSAGVPVVGARGPLLDPSFETSPLRLVDSPGAFAEELLWVQQEPRLADLGAAWVAEHFDPDTLDAKLLRAAIG